MSMDQRNLNQYELQQLLASDHLSEFWKAFDTQQRRFVHIKILHIPQAALGDFAPKFFQETQKLSSLQHPNIASIVDTQIVTGAQANKAFVVTEYLDGQLLSDFLRETVHSGAFLAPNEVVKLLMALGSAIDYAHQQVIIHGAIQPGNILLTKRDADRNSVGEIKLLGFGGQHLIPPHALPLEATEYIAPERAQGLHENLRGDIYSMGVLLYELSTGTLPFEGASPAETLALQIQVVPTSPALINPQIRPALTAVIMRSLAKEPVNRFPNAMTFVGAVARALQVSNDFPSLVNQTPNFTPSSFSGPISTSGLNNSSTHFAPYPPQSSGVYSALPTVGNYSPVQNPPARNTGGIPPVYSQKSSESGAFAKQYSQPYSQPANPAFQPAKSGRQPGRLYLILTSLLILALLVSAFGFFFVNNRDKFFGTAAAPLPSLPIIGQAFFVSSGQVNPNTIQGTADRLQIALQHLPEPGQGKSYYIWLLASDQNSSETQPLLLASSIHGGQITTTFQGNLQHSNLLATYNRILITKENADAPPPNPSLDPQTHTFAAEFSTVPNLDDVNKYSLLDHMRHLIAQDPKLKAAGLAGGLDIWLFKDTTKVLETAGSIHDSQSTDFIRRQLVRILDYLDSSRYIQTENIPAGLPPVEIDPNIAKVAILNFDSQQDPPGYLKHIGNHLRAVTAASGVSPSQKALAIQINLAINNVQAWMERVHLDTQKLIHLPANQLTQPVGAQLLDDLFTQANMALVGQTDPNTNQVKEGVIQIHYNIQRLATFDLTSCQGNAGVGCE